TAVLRPVVGGGSVGGLHRFPSLGHLGNPPAALPAQPGEVYRGASRQRSPVRRYLTVPACERLPCNRVEKGKQADSLRSGQVLRFTWSGRDSLCRCKPLRRAAASCATGAGNCIPRSRCSTPCISSERGAVPPLQRVG